MNIYAKAAIPTLLVFLIGIMAGIWIDNFRVTAIRKGISEFELTWNDAQLFNEYFRSLGLESCISALEQNLIYNSRIYQNGNEIEKTIKSNAFTPEIEEEWKRYNLLQVQFWLNSIELKKGCGFDYHTIVHLDRLHPESAVEGIDNRAQTQILLDLKDKCGNKIMLIPLDVDLDLVSIDAIVNQYDIQQFPALLIDEDIVLQGLSSEEDLLNIVKC